MIIFLYNVTQGIIPSKGIEASDKEEPIMQHKCKVTVIDKKCFNDFQEQYLADPQSGPCPFYNVGDEFIFERYGGEDTFWREGNGTQCAEAWDCISRYIYTALQGGSIMRGWTNDERMMIACCNDGTRPVILKSRGWIIK